MNILRLHYSSNLYSHCTAFHPTFCEDRTSPKKSTPKFPVTYGRLGTSVGRLCFILTHRHRSSGPPPQTTFFISQQPSLQKTRCHHTSFHDYPTTFSDAIVLFHQYEVHHCPLTAATLVSASDYRLLVNTELHQSTRFRRQVGSVLQRGAWQARSPVRGMRS